MSGSRCCSRSMAASVKKNVSSSPYSSHLYDSPKCLQPENFGLMTHACQSLGTASLPNAGLIENSAPLATWFL